MARNDSRDLRHINIVDSRVGLGAWAKGRSSSWQLNGVLRSCLPYSLAGRKQLFNIWSASAHNPSDDPTRNVEIRKPKGTPDWLRPHLERAAPHESPNVETAGAPLSHRVSVASPPIFRMPSVASGGSEHTDSQHRNSFQDEINTCTNHTTREGQHHPIEHFRVQDRALSAPPGLDSVVPHGAAQFCLTQPSTIEGYASYRKHEIPTLYEAPLLPNTRFREIFAGCSRLSEAFTQFGWIVAPPLDAYRNNIYNPKHDVLLVDVQRQLDQYMHEGWCYIHFGLPCASFCQFNVNFNKGARTRSLPRGNGTLPREALGNKLMDVTLKWCTQLWRDASWFSFENPAGSYVWACQGMKSLLRKRGVRVIRFHQCEYGLQLPDSGPHDRCRKDTFIVTNAPLDALHRLCTHTHFHVTCIGGIRTDEGWRKRSALAGQYPEELCHEWAKFASVGSLCW